MHTTSIRPGQHRRGQNSSRWFHGVQVPMRVIRKYAQEVAKHFHPSKIILFGSYAYGQPDEHSDVDMMVVMPARNQIDMACKIDRTVAAPFPLDLIVRQPEKLAGYLARGESFHTEIVTKGRVLFEE